MSRTGVLVVVAARRPQAAKEALLDLNGIEVDERDPADLGSVRGFAERFVASGRSIDILINNAAVMVCHEARVGDGRESQCRFDTAARGVVRLQY
ncbi:hypothetical protein [Acerihabitans arboris]|uniref:hypothetical protein n=1 Tax=Acerihabitans arboris TaxID=2691583 RepID=UPI0035E41845